ncbi:N-glycosidase F, putative [Minicystis rosea]|nr:N-glycosidase F, putative [Minicystis rosea]
MGRTSLHLFPILAIPVVAAMAAPACSSSNEQPTTASTSSSSGSGGGTGGTGTGGSGGGGPDPTLACQALSLPSRPFATGPYGTHRGELADDFTIDLADGTSFHFKQRFSGCDTYQFIPDVIPVSDADTTSIWEKENDLRTLLTKSPKNVHYFFVSRTKDAAAATANIQAMQARVTKVVGSLAAADNAQWKDRVHVIAKPATELGGWLTTTLGSIGRIGFGIDRRQTIRGAGSLADVARVDNSIMTWPFKSNLAYAANEPLYQNAQNDVLDRLDTDGATVVDLWKGETLEEYADTKVTLPAAAAMAGFDTLEIEVTQQCPNPEDVELGNCGAWDYIASFLLADDLDHQVELARFITSYHRETHWVVDASDMLPILASGGEHTFRWSFAPEWNKQPTATKLSLRFSNQKKGMRPTTSTFLFAGGDFGSMYNASYAPIDVPIPATAKKVELFTIITGHGGATNNCSEFCNHQHEFTINEKAYKHEFPNAGTSNKCVPNVDKGMTPNQAGTWWYGRGGWCPGQQVDPWVQDVTADVKPGETATISYRGLYKNAAPPDGSGNIVMVSYLVVHE